MWSFIWIVLIGFLAGMAARFLSPGPNEPSGFILTAVLGIVGAFLATFLGQMVGWYRLQCRDGRGRRRAVHLEQAGGARRCGRSGHAGGSASPIEQGYAR